MLQKKGHYQDVCFSRIKKELPLVNTKGVPLKTQKNPPQGWVNEISEQNSTLMVPITQAPQLFAPF